MRYCLLSIQYIRVDIHWASRRTIAIIYHRCCEKCVRLKQSDKQTNKRIDQYIASNKFLYSTVKQFILSRELGISDMYQYTNHSNEMHAFKCQQVNTLTMKWHITHYHLHSFPSFLTSNIFHALYFFFFFLNAIVVAESFFHLIQFKWAQPAWIKPHEF